MLRTTSKDDHKKFLIRKIDLTFGFNFQMIFMGLILDFNVMLSHNAEKYLIKKLGKYIFFKSMLRKINNWSEVIINKISCFQENCV